MLRSRLRSHHSFSGAHRVRPSNSRLVRLGSPARAMVPQRCALSHQILGSRPRSRLRSRQSRSAASKLAPPALARPRSPARTECARRTCGSSALASFSSESNQLRQQTCHRTSRPSASPTCCVLATRSPARTECARRTRGSPAFRPLWLVRVHLEFQSFPSIVSA